MEVAKAASAMKTSLDCIPCLVRQSLKVARMATEDVAVHESILREMLRHVSGLDLNRPPLVGQGFTGRFARRPAKSTRSLQRSIEKTV